MTGIYHLINVQCCNHMSGELQGIDYKILIRNLKYHIFMTSDVSHVGTSRSVADRRLRFFGLWNDHLSGGLWLI